MGGGSKSSAWNLLLRCAACLKRREQVHGNHKAYEKTVGGGGVLGGIIYLSLHCHHQNDSCIKMGSDESRFNVSLTVRDKVTRQCPQTTIFEEK